MIQAHLPTDSVGLFQADIVDESLIAIAVDSTEKFMRASRNFAEVNKINVAVQTKEVTDAKGGSSEASHLGSAPRR